MSALRQAAWVPRVWAISLSMRWARGDFQGAGAFHGLVSEACTWERPAVGSRAG